MCLQYPSTGYGSWPKLAFPKWGKHVRRRDQSSKRKHSMATRIMAIEGHSPIGIVFHQPRKLSWVAKVTITNLTASVQHWLYWNPGHASPDTRVFRTSQGLKLRPLGFRQSGLCEERCGRHERSLTHEEVLDYLAADSLICAWTIVVEVPI